MRIVRLQLVDKTEIDLEVRSFRVGCHAPACDTSTETGIVAHSARHAARAGQGDTRTGVGPGSSIYPRTDYCQRTPPPDHKLVRAPGRDRHPGRHELLLELALDDPDKGSHTGGAETS